MVDFALSQHLRVACTIGPVTVVFGVHIVDTSLIFKKPCVDLEASIFNLKIVNFKKYSGPIWTILL